MRLKIIHDKNISMFSDAALPEPDCKGHYDKVKRKIKLMYTCTYIRYLSPYEIR